MGPSRNPPSRPKFVKFAIEFKSRLPLLALTLTNSPDVKQSPKAFGLFRIPKFIVPLEEETGMILVCVPLLVLSYTRKLSISFF